MYVKQTKMSEVEMLEADILDLVVDLKCIIDDKKTGADWEKYAQDCEDKIKIKMERFVRMAMENK